MAVEVVDRSGVDRAGAGDDRERLEAGDAVGGDGGGEGVEVDGVVVLDGDEPQGVGAQAQQLAALAVALCTSVEA